MPGATLISHCGTRTITREELQEIPAPEATRTHQPIPHFGVVQSLIESLSFRHLVVTRDEYAVSRDGMRMFGVMDLDAGFAGCSFSIGLRNSNDKSMRLALTVGYRVIVCDNMAFQGDFTPVLYKHSRKLELVDVISIGVDKIQRSFEPLTRQVRDWQSLTLRDSQAKLVIYGAFLEGKIGVPQQLMPTVHRYYFAPEHDVFAARTFWSLSNAFTSALKHLKPLRQFQGTAKVGCYLSETHASIRKLWGLAVPL